MIGYLARRLAAAVPVFLGTTFLVFVLVNTLPGDPLRAMYGDRPLSPSVEAELRDQLDLDEPVLQRYADYLIGITRGDLGQDFRGREVGDLVGERVGVTVRLALTTFVVQTVIGCGLGALAARRAGGPLDVGLLLSTTIFVAVPVFVLAIALQLVVGVRFGLLPFSGDRYGWPRSYLLPALVMALAGMAPVFRLVRSTLAEVDRTSHVSAARWRGLPERVVFLRHVARNSLVPVVTYLGVDLGYLMGGTVVIEAVFNLPGLGQLLQQSIEAHEGTVVVGASTVMIIAFVVANLLVDLSYGLLDPRMRDSKG